MAQIIDIKTRREIDPYITSAACTSCEDCQWKRSLIRMFKQAAIESEHILGDEKVQNAE